MPVVRAFRGLRYNLDRVDIARVVAPPYDVIPEPRRAALCAGDPHNVAHLTLGREPLTDAPPPTRYEQAARDLAQWRVEQVLVRDPRPALYVYEQEYRLANDPALTRRRGVIALVKLHRYEERVILPHEGTLPRPKADRLKLMEATQCSFSPVFAIYSDPSDPGRGALDRLARGEPEFEVTDGEGVAHRLWAATDLRAVRAFEEAMADQTIVIADGHHRYETALAYRDAMRSRHGEHPDAPWQYALMFLCNVDAADVTIFPCHRLIRKTEPEVLASLEHRAAEAFDVERIPLPGRGPERVAALEDRLQQMAARGGREHVFAAYWGADYAVTLAIRDYRKALGLCGESDGGVLWELDVALLHCALIEGLLGLRGARAASGENVFFTREPREAIASVDAGESAIALFVNATRVDQVIRLAATGRQMPQKGTYFWPKLLTGTVMHDLRAR